MLRQALAAGVQTESVQVVALALEKLADAVYLRNETAARQLFSLAQEMRRVSGVTVQPVDQADHALLAARLQRVLAAAPVIPAIAEGIQLNWRAIHAEIEAV